MTEEPNPEGPPYYVLPSAKAEVLLVAIQEINKNILAMTEILTAAIQQPYDGDLEPMEVETDDETAH